jgi:hypothetical protein
MLIKEQRPHKYVDIVSWSHIDLHAIVKVITNSQNIHYVKVNEGSPLFWRTHIAIYIITLIPTIIVCCFYSSLEFPMFYMNLFLSMLKNNFLCVYMHMYVHVCMYLF